jgi:hypothetical protein
VVELSRLIVIKQDKPAVGSCGKPHCRRDRIARHRDPLVVNAFDQSESTNLITFVRTFLYLRPSSRASSFIDMGA